MGLNDKLVYIGIDPGVSGAIAFLFSDGRLKVWDMPTRLRPDGKRREVCPNTLVGMIKNELEQWNTEKTMFYTSPAIAIVEKVAAMSGREDSASSFQFGRSFGIVLGALAGLQIGAILTRPQMWKQLVGVTADKKTSLKKARDLFSEHKEYFARAKDDGRAEAALLAWAGPEIWAFSDEE